jgi:drug/metabolite transporter superfamily protein YnfA
MTLATTLLLLVFSALLEVGGDALIRSGQREHRLAFKLSLMFLGAAALAIYGYLVNVSPWDFGRLLGLYVVIFFVVAQLISWLVFHQKPGLGVLVGGSFIIAGGFILTFFNPK